MRISTPTLGQKWSFELFPKFGLKKRKRRTQWMLGNRSKCYNTPLQAYGSTWEEWSINWSIWTEPETIGLSEPKKALVASGRSSSLLVAPGRWRCLAPKRPIKCPAQQENFGLGVFYANKKSTQFLPTFGGTGVPKKKRLGAWASTVHCIYIV